MEDLIRFINQFQKLDTSTEEAIRENFFEETFQKNDYLLKKGQISKKIYFIQSGLVRRFYLKEETESTVWLYHDGHWITSMSSYFNQKPSFEFFQACEETTVYSLNYPDEQILLQLPLFQKFHVEFLRKSIAAFDEFHFVFSEMQAREKYNYLVENFPLIIQKAKQKHIASLLNVSQETLSRIRSSFVN